MRRFFLVLILFLCTTSRVDAAGEFLANYDVQYAVSPTGKTIVTQQVTLTNQLPNFYPQEYALMLDSDKIRNVISYDDGGVITPDISVTDGKTKIRLVFNVKAIGLGKSLTFSLRYEHAGVASKSGSIWEIYVPGVVNDPDIGTYDVTLSVPPSFGPAAYLSPKPANGKTWNKEQMMRGGITGAYGTSQNFDLTLTYSLTNSRARAEIQEVALPPNTAYQKVTLESITPAPFTVVSDADGNWIAQYEIHPRKTISITVKATATLYITPRKEYEKRETDVAIDEYLKEAAYWETKDEAIVRLATEYNTPRKIYDFVVSALDYEYEKVNGTPLRLGAASALKNRDKAVCMEFTDLFIAIARAAGIPARRIVGYAYTNNPKLRPLSLVTDVLHAWPEYYDTQLKVWIPVDPTWADTTGGVDYFTKLDFNHIAFAINGLDSIRPYPAGYYRAPQASRRDVLVEFAASPKEKGADVTTSIEFPTQVGAGTNVEGALVITNKGGESAYDIEVAAFSEPNGINVTETISELLPYAVVRIPMRGVFAYSVTSIPGQIRVRVNDATLTHSFQIRPLYWLIALGIITVLVAILVAVYGIRLVWKYLKTR